MSRLDASVVIISYNTKALTLRCLDALLATATDDVSFEVIVVDNASHDGSADAIAERFPAVRLVRSGQNVGWGRGVNRAAIISEADYLLLLNPDTEPRGPVVENLVRFAREHPGNGLYTGRTLRDDGSDDGYSCQRPPTLWSVFCFASGLSTVFRRQRWANPDMLPGLDRQTVQEIPAVSGCIMLVHRPLFMELGGFDPTYFLYSEDIDLSVRAVAAGARPLLQPAAAVVHRGGASSSSVGQRVGLLRGKVTFFRRHWSRSRAGVGVALLITGVALRAAAALALRRRHAAWLSVFGQRATWKGGWAEIDEPRPGAEPARHA